MQTFINPKKPGESVTTSLTQDEAAELLKGRTDKFASDLRRNPTLHTPSQKFWFYKMAEDIKNPNKRQGISVGAGFAKLQEMFKQASLSLKKPRVKFIEDGETIVLSLAGADSKNPNHIYLKVNNLYCGKINPEGQFFPTQDCSDKIKNYLKNFAENPALVAREYGRRTGNCCFCKIRLTRNESLTAGYGPICAGHYGLPWG